MLNDTLSTVHDAIRESSLEVRKPEEVLAVASYKIDKKTQEAAAQICETNGTSLSSFLRWCCKLLVNDYKGGDLPVGFRED
jgi:hypothetical protein